ncbi:MAG: Uncharacterized protein LiPW15_329 [Parcubacteria group bacterium LiPW_15]|nr:MAG: Uncharacterized protein LiPW15_329 [Parcubacteria group bacterium LiPW_15]
MITLKKFYFEPTFNDIQPIEFSTGLNFIIGEESEKNENQIEAKKMNGVGKSMLIEMINFCLFKDLKNSRVDRIPSAVLSPQIFLCLELEIETDKSLKALTIKRSTSEKNNVFVFDAQEEKEFEKAEDAKEYVEDLIFRDSAIKERPSLRSLLSLAIRDERTSYNNILYPYTESAKGYFGDAIKPHLYFFDFDLALVDKIKSFDKKLDSITEVMKALRDDIRQENVDPKDIEVYLNELRDRVEKLDFSIKKLQPGEAVLQTQQELKNLEEEIRRLVSEKVAREYVVRQIKSLPRVEKVNSAEIKAIYNQFKKGLGDLVNKSFEEVQAFQLEVQAFQNGLMTEKLQDLNKEINELEIRIDELDEKIAKIYSKTTAPERIEELKSAIIIFREKNSELDKLSSAYNMLTTKKGEHKRIMRERQAAIEALDAQLIGLSIKIESFRKDLEQIHEFIAGNKAYHFQIEVNEKGKEFINFDYRIKLDGSSGINRIKTFIYDVLLMLNTYTSKRHLGFLIHDNIFASVGKDDMSRALNYLNAASLKKPKFQYIVTINKDEFDSSVKDFDFDYRKKVRATFTREAPFLRQEYREI